MDEDYHAKVNSLISQFALAPRVALAERPERLTADALSGWMKERMEADNAQFLDIDPEQFEGQSHYRDLTLDQWDNLRDLIDNVAAQGRMIRQVLVGGRKQDLEVVAERINTSIFANNKQRPRKLGTRTDEDNRASNYQALKYGVIKARAMARELDGWRDDGPVQQALIAQIDKAELAKVIKLQEVGKDLTDLFIRHFGGNHIRNGLRALKKKVYVSELENTEFVATMRQEDILSMALNWGNADNRVKLAQGFTLTEAQIEAIFEEHLTEADWKFVQEVWDYVNSFWPEIAALEKRTTGVTPAKVEAEPSTVTTSDGQEIELAGGYYPLRYDPRGDPEAPDPMHMDMGELTKYGRFGTAQTNRGHTKQRQAPGNRPVQLGFEVLFQHVNMVVNDLTMREAIESAYRTLNASPVRTAIGRTTGLQVYRQLDMWMRDVAVGSTIAEEGWSKWADRLRAGVSVAAMG